MVVHVTLCDAGNPCAWIPAEDVACTGSELSDEINNNAALIDTIREAGVAAIRQPGRFSSAIPRASPLPGWSLGPRAMTSSSTSPASAKPHDG